MHIRFQVPQFFNVESHLLISREIGGLQPQTVATVKSGLDCCSSGASCFLDRASTRSSDSPRSTHGLDDFRSPKSLMLRGGIFGR